ncbi:MAG: tRNA guanosine(34) transglycosylase Tgt [Gemmatimonadota bacterium]|nr:tRNA guanosine(34) transglycosylase Tgt [Gemmatimonadota bacterium]MDH5804193.1 tRNA guanosine(34) transglycosylase Tgt [Gemmatimonadota bacterium]
MFEYEVLHTNGSARVGKLVLPHGEVTTPQFMPVGTQATVKALSPFDLKAVGATMILANTYHLHVRPGEDVIEQLGGLNKVMAFDGPILTDSGGFQVFSLEGMRKVDEDGVTFQSHVDGGRRRLTPESAMEIQWRLGPDVAMAFDHVVPGTADRKEAEDALDRTARWLERCRSRHEELTRNSPNQQTLWPILQGATFEDLRQRAVEQVTSIGDWSGIAVGGLAVGEGRSKMYDVLQALEPALPKGIPRYLMGVGFPEDLLEAIARGIDLFDCVAPTRNGRNGSAFTASGRVNIKNSIHRTDSEPLDETCDCETCTSYSRGYLRHLFLADELLGLRLMSLHNVRFLIRLAEEARKQIASNNFGRWSEDWLTRYNSRG